jgi:hypothetical protein
MSSDNLESMQQNTSREPQQQLEGGMYDATDTLKALGSYLQSATAEHRIFLPQQYRQALLDTEDYLSTQRSPLGSRPFYTTSTPNPNPPSSVLQVSGSPSASNFDSSLSLPLSDSNLASTVRTNVKLNKRTILDKVILHPPGALVEYPETSKFGRIGHIFSMDLNAADDIGSNWFNPIRNFAYSQGEPRGSSGLKIVKCALLTDVDGIEVDCKESHSTCELRRLFIFGNYGTLIAIGQGSKVCSFADWARLAHPHTEASLEDISVHLGKDSLDRSANNTPEQQLFQKTLAFFYSVKKYGCTGPPHELGRSGPSEDDAWNAQIKKARRGHSPKAKCDGNILFQYTGDGKPYLR